MLIFKSTRRFRLLPPFPGSMNTSRMPTFVSREVSQLWDYVNGLGRDFRLLPFATLDSPQMLELDYDFVCANLKWRTKRCVVRRRWLTVCVSGVDVYVVFSWTLPV